MKFRGKVDNGETILQLGSLAAVVARLCKKVVLRLTAEKLYLIQPSTSSSDGILWCEIVVSSFFSEYFFEGLKPEDYPNEEIILEMPTDDFHRALKVDRPDKTIPTTLKLKLSREDFSAGQKRAHETTVGGSKQPVIVIQLNLQQYSSGKILTLTRDLKVEIVARRFWKEYLEPTMPEFDISLFLPQLSKIKSVADKMKHINKYMIVRAYKDGRFQLRTKGSTIKTTVNFPKCDRPEWQNTDENPFSTQKEGPEEAMARVPVKRLIDFTSGDQLKPTRCILNILDSQLIHCFLLLGVDVNLQFLIPSVQNI